MTIFMGGYSETVGFGLSDNFHFGGGGILKLSDLDSVTIFMGGYSETLGFGLSDNFHLGGYSETFGFGLCDNFHLGGYSETLGFGLSDNFHFGGGGILKLYFRIGGILPEFGPKFQPLQQAHASQIVSHILRMWRLIILAY